MEEFPLKVGDHFEFGGFGFEVTKIEKPLGDAADETWGDETWGRTIPPKMDSDSDSDEDSDSEKTEGLFE